MAESRTTSRMRKIAGRVLVVVVVIGIIPLAANFSTRGKPGSLAALGKTIVFGRTVFFGKTIFFREDNVSGAAVHFLPKINLSSTATGRVV